MRLNASSRPSTLFHSASHVHALHPLVRIAFVVAQVSLTKTSRSLASVYCPALQAQPAEAMSARHRSDACSVFFEPTPAAQAPCEPRRGLRQCHAWLQPERATARPWRRSARPCHHSRPGLPARARWSIRRDQRDPQPEISQRSVAIVLTTISTASVFR